MAACCSATFSSDFSLCTPQRCDEDVSLALLLPPPLPPPLPLPLPSLLPKHSCCTSANPASKRRATLLCGRAVEKREGLKAARACSSVNAASGEEGRKEEEVGVTHSSARGTRLSSPCVKCTSEMAAKAGSGLASAAPAPAPAPPSAPCDSATATLASTAAKQRCMAFGESQRLDISVSRAHSRLQAHCRCCRVRCGARAAARVARTGKGGPRASCTEGCTAGW